MIESLARQLVSDLPAEAFRDFDPGDTDTPAILKFLTSVLSTERRYYIVLDGLDECSEAHVEQLTDFIYELRISSRITFKIYYTSRPAEHGILCPWLRPKVYFRLDAPENRKMIESDIREVIYTSLVDQLEGDEPGLQVTDSTIIETIRDTLQNEAQGM